MTPPSPLLPKPSDKPKWRSLAYYNCGICNNTGADYIINVPEGRNGIPIPVCSVCYIRAINKRSSATYKNTNDHERGQEQ
jgi:hypothetical protein